MAALLLIPAAYLFILVRGKWLEHYGARVRGHLDSKHLGAAVLRGADLRGTDLSRSRLDGCDCSQTNLSGANLRDASLSGCNLTQALAPRTSLDGANLAGCDLTLMALSGATLRGAALQGAKLTNVDMASADLSDANLGGCRVDSTVVQDMEEGTEAQSCSNHSTAIFCGADLTNAVVSEAGLRGADFTRARSVGIRAEHAVLDQATLDRCDLKQAVLREASLRGASVREAKLTGADLTDSVVIGADFTGSDLSECILRGVTMSDWKGRSANLSLTCLDDIAITSEHALDPRKGFLELASTHGLESAVLRDAEFLQDYIARAFEYAHKRRRPEAELYPDFVKQVLQNIRAIRNLYLDTPPPTALVTVVTTINKELIAYLARHPDELRKITPRQFEELVAEILASYGWEVQLTRETKDGGYDIFAISKDLRSGVRTSWIIECKKYKEGHKVGVEIARALYAVKGDLRVANAMLATTSDFTRGVHEYKASRYDFDLRNYEAVLEWINSYRPHPGGRLYVRDNRLIVGSPSKLC